MDHMLIIRNNAFQAAHAIINAGQPPSPSRDGLMQAIEQAQGIWKDRINIVEEMAETRQNADRY